MARKKIFVDGDIANTIHQVWDLYTTSQAAKGVCDITLRNYNQHLHSITKYLDIERSMGHSTLKMTKHYCSIYDADIAKNYDRVSPLAQIQKPRETIKNS